VVCLLESALSGLYMLGAQDRLVGVSSPVYESSVRPYYEAMDPRIGARSLPAPGSWDFVNVESVMALRPDLVVMWGSQEESVKALADRGLAVYAVRIAGFADIQQELADLGRLTGTEARAAELRALVQTRLAAVRERLATADAGQRPRTYFMWAQGPLETAGRTSTVQELLDLAGATNVAGDSQLEHLVVNLEQLLGWNPEVVIMWCNDRLDPVDVGRMAGWRALAATRNGRVHELPDAFCCDFWTLKYLFAVELVARWCHHGQRTADTNLESLRAELFAQLYGNRLRIASLPPLSAGGTRP
jgi:iron complex transport system substrate-binding protein